MAFQKHDDEWVYDDSRGIYIAKNYLNGDRAINAFQKAGQKIRSTGEYVCPPYNKKDLEKFMGFLEIIFPGKRSRVWKLEEWMDAIKWSEENNTHLFSDILLPFEILNDEKRGKYIVYIGDEYVDLEDYPDNFPIGVPVREVIE